MGEAVRLWERHLRHWPAGLLVVAAACALAWFGVGSRDRRLGDGPATPRRPVPGRAAGAAKPHPARPTTQPAPPGVELKGTKLKVIDPVAGRVAWELTLASAELSDSGEARLRGVAAVYHNEDGTTSALSARQASLDAGQKSLVFSGSVRLAAPNGSELRAAELRWDAGQAGFVARGQAGGPVTLIRGTSVLRAAELRGDLALKKVKATGGVRLSGQGS